MIHFLRGRTILRGAESAERCVRAADGGVAAVSARAPAVRATAKGNKPVSEQSPAHAAGLRPINPPGLAPGPGYSHAVSVDTPGRLVVISGQVALDGDGNLVGPGDLRAQTRQVFTNLHTALTAAGADWRHVIKLGYFLRDASQVTVVREVRNQMLPPGLAPASTLVEVSRLFRDDLLIEVEALAVVPA
ncbi:UNVERIFIED_ORG: enamine deaminase RidA (YjgF/YER057c/UK114 family) [Actinomadura viridilutea]